MKLAENRKGIEQKLKEKSATMADLTLNAAERLLKNKSERDAQSPLDAYDNTEEKLIEKLKKLELLNLDLDGWDPRENVPQTKVLLDQKMLGMTGLEQWYVRLLSVGELPRAQGGCLAAALPKSFWLSVLPATWCYQTYQSHQTYQT